MRPLRKSLLEPNPKSSSLHKALSSQFTYCLDRPPAPKPHFNETTNTHFPFSRNQQKHHSNNGQTNTLLFNSPHKLKPTSSTLLSSQTRLFSCSSSFFSLSRSHFGKEPVFKVIFHDPISSKFIQRRAFSSENPNPENAVSGENSQPIDAGSSLRKPISLWPGMYHSPVSNALWEARSRIFEEPNDSGTSETELVAKSPSKSRTSICYKFSSDFILREQYRNPWNKIRMGKLVEDLDALAGTISYKHCCNDDGSTRPLLLVTASVDRIVLKKPILVDADLTIVGAVTWVGRSSMEIQMEVIQPTEAEKMELEMSYNPSMKGATNPSDAFALVANFTFVARDAKTGKSALVNQISPETDKEKLLWEEADERNKMRKKKKAEKKRDSENEDMERLNALLSEGRVFIDMPALADRDSILIQDTRHENTFICQPQQRNIHGRIFGGFLMRKAFELAFSNAYAFAGAAPLFVEVDHVDFFRPVDVGNFLRLKSCILYTEVENPAEPLINVEVVAHVTRPELRSSEVSNKFCFTFTVLHEAIKDGLRIRNVVPATEEEARRVLERMDSENSQIAKS
ncbi:acyl-coenzyme A thioesterase 2, chloroplastic-like isoform X1 [Populus nigra]|uniref:acyl-coenzyme A thioesterase 2, chloroplastic-like isoform X1 n=1 Tax=Populus nigra TaxID=3691 RepID=UPI002B26A1D1|nr:acyl-coenzyme A thioesterase 2, chloroplastic-like isoform X1 [Populus nigra]